MGLAIIISLFILFFNQTNPQLNSTEITKSIIDGNITVSKKSYLFYDFNVPSNSYHIKGNFSIFENEKGTISVYVMDEFNLFLWINDKNPYMHFNSEGVNRGTIDEHVPSGGVFFLVFDNLSHETSKNLQVQIDYFYIPY